jgi:hypothetical protein
MFTVRDVINDAYNRTGIWPNSTDALPGEYTNQGELLLKGVVTELNLNNYLAFTRKNVTFTITKPEMIIGQDYIVDGDVIIATDVSMPNFQKINRVYIEKDTEKYELDFISFEEFDGYPNTEDFYSWLEVDDIQGKILFKDMNVNNQATVYYNEAFEITIDSELRIPNIYRQLWTLGLMVEIMKDYPRTDTTQLSVYQASYKTLMTNLEADQVANKVMTRMKRCYISPMSAFQTGSYLL